MKFKVGLLIILFLATHKIVFAQNHPSKLSNQVVKDDFDYLYQSLQEAHYDLFAFKSKEEYDSLFSNLKSSKKAVISVTTNDNGKTYDY